METKRCRICKEKKLKVILDYGKVALADNFIYEKDIKNEKKYPLKLCICKNCKHIQINEIIDPRILFENYVWETGISKSVIEFSKKLYDKVMACCKNKNPRVLEVASNDGTVLSVFKNKGCEILGIDPAKNIVEKANKRGIRSLAKFFNLKTAKEVKTNYGEWDVCIARNVLAHVKELHSFVEGIREIVNKSGFVVIEVPYLVEMFKNLEYDQVFHEHIGYYSLDSIKKLSKKNQQ